MTKKLYKSRKEKMICGVCGGIAEYFDVDPVLVRVIFVILFFAGGSALIAYIIGCLIIPHQPQELAAAPAAQPSKSNDAPEPRRSHETAQAGALFIGIILIIIGSLLLMRNIPVFDYYFWWFRHYAWKFFWPAIIMVIGLVLIFRGFRK